MADLSETVSSVDLGQGAAEALRRVRDSGGPLVITEGGRAAAVLMSIEAYERAERERGLLRLLARGEKEIAEGAGADLDDVLAEADARLADDRA